MKKNKYQIGQTFQREGKCLLKVYKFSDEKYIMCDVLRVVKKTELEKYFKPSELKEGATITLPDGRKKILLSFNGTDGWSWTNVNMITLTEAELDELRAAENVSNVSDVARMHHPERQSRAMRYLPRNAW